MKTKLLLIALLLTTATYSQGLKEVDSWTTDIGTVFKAGDKFMIGKASGQGEYAYIHAKTSALNPNVLFLKEGFDGYEFKFIKIMATKKGQKMGYGIFKRGLQKFMVRLDPAQKKGEIIM